MRFPRRQRFSALGAQLVEIGSKGTSDEGMRLSFEQALAAARNALDALALGAQSLLDS